MGVSRSVSITKTEFQRENLEFKINDMAALGNFEIFDLLEEYKNCSEQMVALEQQSYLFFKTMAEDFFKHTSEKALKNYEEALKLCIKNYELGMIPKSRKAKT